MVFPLSACFKVLYNPRSPLNRSIGFVAIIMVCLCSITYLSYFLPGSSPRSNLQDILPVSLINTGTRGRVPFRWKEGPRRLVSFGDSWSDNGQYPIDPPPEDQVIAPDVARGQVWTEWLCAAMSCAYHDNFARPPIPSSWPSELRGAVIDSSLLNSTWMAQTRVNHTSMIQEKDIKEPAADLRAQVQQWLAFEKTLYGTSRSKEAEKQRTVFCIWFSNWEIWYYSSGVYANAQVAVTKSMDTLFEQLDLIAENWTTDPKIVLLNAVDPTFLPSWRKIRTGPYGLDPLGEDQRHAVLLVEQWNSALDKRASRWNKGQVYVYDTNDWFLSQIREHQLKEQSWGGANGLGSEPGLWQNFKAGCLGSNDNLSDVMQDDGRAIRCSDPKTYLFWDDFHLGPTAMKMVGEGVAADVTKEP